MFLMSLFIIGHIEIGNGYCRTDMMIDNSVITMEYPCELYSELSEVETKLQEI